MSILKDCFIYNLFNLINACFKTRLIEGSIVKKIYSWLQSLHRSPVWSHTVDFLLVFMPCNALLVLVFAYRRFKWGEIVEDLMRDYIAIVVWVLLMYFLVALCNFYRQKKNGVLKHMESKMVNTQLRLD